MKVSLNLGRHNEFVTAAYKNFCSLSAKELEKLGEGGYKLLRRGFFNGVETRVVVSGGYLQVVGLRIDGTKKPVQEFITVAMPEWQRDHRVIEIISSAMKQVLEGLEKDRVNSFSQGVSNAMKKALSMLIKGIPEIFGFSGSSNIKKI